MSEKSRQPGAQHLRDIALTTCILTAFFPCSARSADTNLSQINGDLQAIYKRIQQKYAAADAQPSAPSSPAANPFPPPGNRQQIDGPALMGGEIADNLGSGGAQAATSSRFVPGEELILSTRVNGEELASLFAVTTKKGLRLGLGDFAQIVEFPIYVDPDKATADGWFFNEKNTFHLQRLDDGRLEVQVNNKTYYVAPDDYELGDDFLIEQSDLAKWFGLNFKLDEGNLALDIGSSNKFPVEVRLARRQKSNINQLAMSQSVMPLQESGYTLFSPPMVDIQTSASHSNLVIPVTDTNGNTQEITSSQTNTNYSILASHDLAYLNSQLFINGNDNDALNTAWLTLSRQSDTGELLGPLGATEYQFGDIVPFNAGFGSTQGLGRGVKLSNTPLSQLADNRKVNISGPIQEGWDVELYRNGILLDQRQSISEGRYDFNDVPLEYGPNDFQLIFYGPQGQMETKTESYIADSNTVSSGDGMYRFSLTEVGESVFNLDQYADDPSQQGLMATTILDYGVTDWLAVTGGTSVFEPRAGDTQEFVTLGTNANLGTYGLFSANYLQDQDNQNSVDLNYRTRLFNTSYSIHGQRTQILDANNETQTTENLGATMTGRLFARSMLPLSYQNSWQQTSYNDGRESDYFQNSLAVGGSFGYINNSLTWQRGYTDDPTMPENLNTGDRVLGSLQYRKNFGHLNSRLFANYSLKPTKELYAYGGAFNYNWSNNFNSELRYTYSTANDLYQLNLGLNWRKEPFYITTNAAYNQNGTWAAGVTLRFSLGYEPIERRLFTSDRPLAQSGAVAVRVFEDANMNGIFDNNERPIQNAKVKALQAFREEKTDKDGVAVLSSIYDNTTTDIVVDESTLDGPFMISAKPGVAIKARKGYIDKVDLPVVHAGELDGIIYQKNEAGESEPAPYIMLNLVDDKMQIVASTRSEYDGYYEFTNVKPGHYQLKVDETFTDRRSLKPGKKQLDFSNKGDVITGVDFVLRPLDEAHGYVAVAGHFDTATMLKLYYHILRRRLGGSFVQQPFYIKQPNNGGYLLGLAYFPGAQANGSGTEGSEAEKQTREACAPLVLNKVTCEVQYQDFKY